MKHNNIKFALLLALGLALGNSALAQQFDWVQTYTGPTFQQSQYHMPMSSVTITDMMGRREEVKVNSVGEGQYSLDLTATPQGVYLFTLTTANGHTQTVKLQKY